MNATLACVGAFTEAFDECLRQGMSSNQPGLCEVLMTAYSTHLNRAAVGIATHQQWTAEELTRAGQAIEHTCALLSAQNARTGVDFRQAMQQFTGSLLGFEHTLLRASSAVHCADALCTQHLNDWLATNLASAAVDSHCNEATLLAEDWRLLAEHIVNAPLHDRALLHSGRYAHLSAKFVDDARLLGQSLDTLVNRRLALALKAPSGANTTSSLIKVGTKNIGGGTDDPVAFQRAQSSDWAQPPSWHNIGNYKGFDGGRLTVAEETFERMMMAHARLLNQYLLAVAHSDSSISMDRRAEGVLDHAKNMGRMLWVRYGRSAEMKTRFRRGKAGAAEKALEATALNLAKHLRLYETAFRTARPDDLRTAHTDLLRWISETRDLLQKAFANSPDSAKRLDRLTTQFAESEVTLFDAMLGLLAQRADATLQRQAQEASVDFGLKVQALGTAIEELAGKAGPAEYLADLIAEHANEVDEAMVAFSEQMMGLFTEAVKDNLSEVQRLRHEVELRGGDVLAALQKTFANSANDTERLDRLVQQFTTYTVALVQVTRRLAASTGDPVIQNSQHGAAVHLLDKAQELGAVLDAMALHATYVVGDDPQAFYGTSNDTGDMRRFLLARPFGETGAAQAMIPPLQRLALLHTEALKRDLARANLGGSPWDQRSWGIMTGALARMNVRRDRTVILLPDTFWVNRFLNPGAQQQFRKDMTRVKFAVDVFTPLVLEGRHNDRNALRMAYFKQKGTMSRFGAWQIYVETARPPRLALWFPDTVRADWYNFELMSGTDMSVTFYQLNLLETPSTVPVIWVAQLERQRTDVSFAEWQEYFGKMNEDLSPHVWPGQPPQIPDKPGKAAAAKEKRKSTSAAEKEKSKRASVYSSFTRALALMRASDLRDPHTGELVVDSPNYLLFLPTDAAIQWPKRDPARGTEELLARATRLTPIQHSWLTTSPVEAKPVLRAMMSMCAVRWDNDGQPPSYRLRQEHWVHSCTGNWQTEQALQTVGEGIARRYIALVTGDTDIQQEFQLAIRSRQVGADVDYCVKVANLNARHATSVPCIVLLDGWPFPTTLVDILQSRIVSKRGSSNSAANGELVPLPLLPLALKSVADNTGLQQLQPYTEGLYALQKLELSGESTVFIQPDQEFASNALQRRMMYTAQKFWAGFTLPDQRYDLKELVEMSAGDTTPLQTVDPAIQLSFAPEYTNKSNIVMTRYLHGSVQDVRYKISERTPLSDIATMPRVYAVHRFVRGGAAAANEQQPPPPPLNFDTVTGKYSATSSSSPSSPPPESAVVGCSSCEQKQYCTRCNTIGEGHCHHCPRGASSISVELGYTMGHALFVHAGLLQRCAAMGQFYTLLLPTDTALLRACGKRHFEHLMSPAGRIYAAQWMAAHCVYDPTCVYDHTKLRAMGAQHLSVTTVDGAQVLVLQQGHALYLHRTDTTSAPRRIELANIRPSETGMICVIDDVLVAPPGIETCVQCHQQQ